MDISTKLNEEKGQGLVEYALILVLVSVVVLGVLLLLGPGVGNTFTEINSSLTTNSDAEPTAVPPTATPVPTWTFCATENDFCNFSGTAPVRYGLGGTWAQGTYTNGVSCTNGVFGDPLYGVVKLCQVFQ